MRPHRACESGMIVWIGEIGSVEKVEWPVLIPLTARRLALLAIMVAKISGAHHGNIQVIR